MSSASLALPLPADLDAARKLSVASSTSSGISFTHRRPFTPIDIQGGSPTASRRGDSDSPLKLMESSLYAVYAMETFTFGTTSPAGPSKQSPPLTPEATGSSSSQPSSPRSHASHFFPNASNGEGSTTVPAMTRTPLPLIAQTNHPPSPRSSHGADSAVTSPSSMFTNSIRNSTQSNVTTPSDFSFEEADDQWTEEGGGSEDDISIGSTRYEDGGSSVSSRRGRRSSGWGVDIDDGRHVPPILEDETEFSDMLIGRRMSAPDLVPPPPRSDSLRPALEITTTALSENNVDDDPTTAKPPYTPAFHFPTRLMTPADTPRDDDAPAALEQDLESDWIEQLRGGIVTFEIDDGERNLNYPTPQPIPSIPSIPSIPDPTPPADETASSPTLRSPNTGRRLSFFSLFRKPDASTTATSAIHTLTSAPDTFESHAQQYHHPGNNENWVFRRSFADEKKAERRRDNNHLPSREKRERLRKTEVWTVPGIKGIFLLKRIFSDPPTTYQLAVQHLPPKSTRSSSERTPVLLVHRHSRVQGFSLGWVRKDGSLPSPDQLPSDGEVKPRKPHSLHLLATRTVQQSYTSTVSWRRLEDYGLLSSPVESKPVALGMSSGSSSGSSERTHRSRGSMSSRPHGSNEQIPPLPRLKPPSPTPSEELLSDDDLDSILGIAKKRKTSHFAAFSTISASDMHRLRGNDLISATKTDDNLVRKVLWSNSKEPAADKSVADKKKKKISPSRSAPAYLETPRHLEGPITPPQQPSSPREPPLTPTFTSYVPPWLTLNESALTHNLTKADEDKRRRLETLGKNFKDVGLLASAPSRSDNRLTQSQLSRKTRSMIAAVTESWTNVFDGIPEEAMFMLLPLWIGGTEGKRFLLIWYKAWDPPSSTDLPSTTGSSTTSFSKFKAIYSTKARQEEKERERRQTISTDTVKSTRSTRSTKSTTSTATTRGGGARRSQIEPSESRPFLVNARPVSLADIQGTDIRVPQCGLQGISVPVEDDASRFTPGGELLADYILARCPASTQPPPAGDEDARRMDTVGGVEFDETCLLRLGLAYEISTANGERPSTDSKSFRDLRLTPVGRSIVELAWIGAIALREFQTI